MMRPKIGQWCRIGFEDVGARDGICVERLNEQEFRFLEPFEPGPCRVQYKQVLKLGKRVEAKDSGL